MYQNYYDPNEQSYNKKKSGPKDNYYATLKRDYNQQLNNNIPQNMNNQIEKTNDKINVIMYKNGFILNNGPFRDISNPENRKFMEEVDQGAIPDELMKIGINKNLGVLIEDRKNEVYSMNPITSPLKEYIYGNQSDINNLSQNMNINTNFNDYNYISNSMNNDSNIRTEIKIHPPIILKPGEEFPFEQLQNLYNIKNPNPNKYEYHIKPPVVENNKFPNAGKDRRNTVDLTKMSLTPVWEGGRKNIFFDKNEKKSDKKKKSSGFKKKESKSVPKKKEEKKKFKTFESLIKEEKEKEEKGEKNDEEKEEKKFQAFSGQGQIIGNINTQGLHVQKDIKNIVDKNIPISTFSIRLFNGEIVKCEFNHTQTLRDIYYYVQKISGSNNFYLLDGFPPKPLREYNKLIGELKLDNTILTQKIK